MNRMLALAGVVWLEMVRRKDVYVLFILIAALLVGTLGLDVFGLGGVVGYIKDAGLFAAWVLGWVLAVNTSVRQLPQEESRGTVFVLLAKPVSRLEVVIGKWLGAWLVVWVAVVCFYLAVWGVTLIKGGGFELESMAQGLLLHGVAIGMVIAIGIAFTTRMNGDAAAALTYTVTGAAFLILPRVPAMLVGDKGVSGTLLSVLYYLLPHFELFDMRRRVVHGWGAAPWAVVGGVVLYGMFWIAAMLILAWIGYRQRRFSRGNLL
jgi:ABC-type transport system involved in multi-copper enzyme maturation permease subunit